MTTIPILPENLMERLAAPFELWQHDYRTNGYGDTPKGYITYIGVEHAIGRLNAVLGDRWNLEIIDTQFVTVPGYKERGATEPPQVSGVVTRCRISWTDNIGTVYYRDGQGAAQFTSQADDLDKVVKAAQAEAFKKATHVLGVGAYLWDKGLADRIAYELLRAEGRQWAAKDKPRAPENMELAKRIIGEIKGEPAAGATAPSSDAMPEEWLAANRKFSAAVDALVNTVPGAREQANAVGQAVADMIAGIARSRNLPGTSRKDIPAELLAQMAGWLTDKDVAKNQLIASIRKHMTTTGQPAA